MAHVREGIRVLEQAPLPYAPGWARVLRAGLALRKGDTDQTVRHLHAAIACFDANGFKMYAAAARRRAGQLAGGTAGRSLLEESERAMVAQGVIDLEATTEMLLPACRA